MKNNKNTKAEAVNNNHHANPSRMNPEVAAMQQNEKSSIEKSKPHDLLNADKREAARVIHTNGSNTSDRL